MTSGFSNPQTERWSFFVGNVGFTMEINQDFCLFEPLFQHREALPRGECASCMASLPVTSGLGNPSETAGHKESGTGSKAASEEHNRLTTLYPLVLTVG